jgi:hypothetical protein
MGDLGNTCSFLGRHEDALALKEKTLELLRRVLPENHPDIGEGLCSDALACLVVTRCVFDVQVEAWPVLPSPTIL